MRSPQLIYIVLCAAVLLGVALWIGLSSDRGLNKPLPDPIQEHYDEVDKRFEEMLPRDRALAPTPTFPEDSLTIRLRFRIAVPDDGGPPVATVRVDAHGVPVDFPIPTAKERPAWIQARKDALAGLKRQVSKKLRAHGGSPAKVQGEVIEVWPSKVGAGQLTVLLMNIFLELEMTDVSFSPFDEARADAPSSGGKDPDPKHLVIELNEAGEATVAGRSMELGEQPLQPVLREVFDAHAKKHDMAVADVGVLIHADWGTKWKYVERIMRACHAFKIYRINFAVKPLKRTGAAK